MNAPPLPSAVALLEFGRLLCGKTVSKQIDEAEIHVSALLEKDKNAHSVFGIGKGKPLDPLAVRVLAQVAYTCLCTGKGLAPFGDVVRAAAGDSPAAIIGARQAIAGLLLSGQLAFKYTVRDCLQPGNTLLEYLAGGPAALPLVPTEEWLLSERRKQEAAAHKKALQKPLPLPTAKQLAARIAEQVVGLEPQVRTVAVRVALHLRRAALIRGGRDPRSWNECLMLIGKSGVGKTFLIESAGAVCGLPFSSFSATEATSSGYAGLDISDALKGLLVAAGGDVQKARFGVAFVDEADKKRSSGWGVGSRDVAGASVQAELLRMVEGTDVEVGGRRSYEHPPVTFNTKGTFFCLAGAFSGLDQCLLARCGAAIGFGPALTTRVQQRYIHDALVDFGMLVELINRLTAILVLPEPTVEQLADIAVRGVVPACNRLLAAVGSSIEVDTPAVNLLAEHALATHTYARGIKSVVSRLVEELVYEERKGTLRISPAEVSAAIEAAG